MYMYVYIYTCVSVCATCQLHKSSMSCSCTRNMRPRDLTVQVNRVAQGTSGLKPLATALPSTRMQARKCQPIQQRVS